VPKALTHHNTASSAHIACCAAVPFPCNPSAAASLLLGISLSPHASHAISSSHGGMARPSMWASWGSDGPHSLAQPLPTSRLNLPWLLLLLLSLLLLLLPVFSNLPGRPGTCRHGGACGGLDEGPSNPAIASSVLLHSDGLITPGGQ